VLTPVADGIAARRKTVHGTEEDSLSRAAYPVSARGRTIARTEFRGLVQTAKTIAATAAVHQAVDVVLASLAYAVAARSQAVKGATATVGAVFVQPADGVTAWPAIHRTEHGRVGVDALPVAAEHHALGVVSAGQTQAGSTVVLDGAFVAVVALLSLFHRKVDALAAVAEIIGATVVIAAVQR